jgi:hypothetical protein
MNNQLGLADGNKELTIVFGAMQPKIHFGAVSFAGLPYYDPNPPINILFKTVKYH